MCRIITIILLVFVFQSAVAIKISDAQVADALANLDDELYIKDVYIANRKAVIDSIRKKCQSASGVDEFLMSTMNLADAYTSFNNDSALYYYNIGIEKSTEAELDSLRIAFTLKRSTYMPLAAFIEEPVRHYMSIDSTVVKGELEDLYYNSARQMYSYISSFYISYPDIYQQWKRKELVAQSRLLTLLDENSVRYKLNRGEIFFANGEYAKAKVVLEDLIGKVPVNDNIYARATHKLAEIAKFNGDSNGYIYFLTQSAISDVKSATLEVMSLQELGAILFEKGDVNRSYRYQLAALANAVECGAAVRMIHSSSVLPVIEKAHRAEIDTWQNRIYMVLGGMALLILLLGGGSILLRGQMKKLTLTRMNLEKANRVKEVYISQFLNLCSIYMDKLNQLCSLVNRKISANKVDDLYKITKSGKFVEEQSKEFYEIFDDAFLHIYPTFVLQVNKLLRDEEQIVLKDGERLNTDLRILAFMRLGIEESARIAQVLNYSVNTIYTYKNKLKNKAINRDTFDADIMNISSVSG